MLIVLLIVLRALWIGSGGYGYTRSAIHDGRTTSGYGGFTLVLIVVVALALAHRI